MLNFGLPKTLRCFHVNSNNCTCVFFSKDFIKSLPYTKLFLVLSLGIYGNRDTGKEEDQREDI